MLMLRDLRNLCLRAQAEIAGVILGECAQAARDKELLELTDPCHHEVEMRGKWLRTPIKESSPQIRPTG